VPELPETETIARDLDRAVRGATIVAVSVSHADVLREVTSAAELSARTVGATIGRCWRRAKLVVLDLSTGDRLVIQPRFTGGLLVDDGTQPAVERRYAVVTWTLDDGRRLHYRDVRRLGTVSLMDVERFDAYTGALGVEPLGAAFTGARLAAVLGRSRQAIKKVLMDQRQVAGVGNIYANEALWLARLDPSREARRVGAEPAGRLRDALVAVLGDSIAARGTSFRDYRDAAGGRGSYSAQLAVYGRAGQPCPRCGRRLIGTHAVDGRATVFCAECQR
jgi:formamidopyrimidine-DNA glycosylase